MGSEISKSFFSSYVPVKTELEGLYHIGFGTANLGFSTFVKVHELCTGEKAVMKYIEGDVSLFFANLGIAAIKDGVQMIFPAVGVVLSIYLISTELL